MTAIAALPRPLTDLASTRIDAGGVGASGAGGFAPMIATLLDTNGNAPAPVPTDTAAAAIGNAAPTVAIGNGVPVDGSTPPVAAPLDGPLLSVTPSAAEQLVPMPAPSAGDNALPNLPIVGGAMRAGMTVAVMKAAIAAMSSDADPAPAPAAADRAPAVPMTMLPSAPRFAFSRAATRRDERAAAEHADAGDDAEPADQEADDTAQPAPVIAAPAMPVEMSVDTLRVIPPSIDGARSVSEPHDDVLVPGRSATSIAGAPMHRDGGAVSERLPTPTGPAVPMTADAPEPHATVATATPLRANDPITPSGAFLSAATAQMQAGDTTVRRADPIARADAPTATVVSLDAPAVQPPGVDAATTPRRTAAAILPQAAQMRPGTPVTDGAIRRRAPSAPTEGTVTLPGTPLALRSPLVSAAEPPSAPVRFAGDRAALVANTAGDAASAIALPAPGAATPVAVAEPARVLVAPGTPLSSPPTAAAASASISGAASDRKDGLASAAPIAAPHPAETVTPLATGTVLPAAQAFGAAMRRAIADERRSLARADHDPFATVAPGTITPAAAVVQAVVAPTAADVDTADRRWPEAMIRHIERLRDDANATDTRIRLHPDALGAVDVALRREGDTVHVRLAAAEPAARALLTDAQPRLADLAEARGLRLGSSIAGGTSDRDAGTGAQQQRSPAPQRPRSATPAPAAARTVSDDLSDIRIA